MGGVWSIWLASTVMGLKFFTFEGILASFLVLVSVQSFLERRDKTYLLPPLFLSMIVLYEIMSNSLLFILLLPYLILFLIQRVFAQRVRMSQKAYVQIGVFLLTIPFPLMAGFSADDTVDVLAPLLLLILITFFNLFLAEAVIFRKTLCRKNYLSLLLLIVFFLFLSPPVVFATVSLTALLLMFFAFKLSLRKLGFSLLGLHILFAVEYLVFF